LVRRDPDEVRPSDRRRGPSRTTRGGRAAARALAAEGQRKGRGATSDRGRSEGARTRATPSQSASGMRSEGARTRNTRSQGKRAQSSGSEGTRTRPRSEGVRTRNTGARSEGVRTRNTGARSESARTRSNGTRSQGRRSADLSSQTKAELYQRARKAGIERSSSMNKPELIRALERARA
jgi:hypothetical protein